MKILAEQSMARRLADFVVETKFEDLPQEVVHAAKRVLLDSIGCILNATASERGRLAAELAKRLGGPPESSIIGTREKVSCANAAFAHGESIYALNFDCVYPSPPHIVPAVLPPAIAVGESRSVSGKELLVAVVLGVDVACRVNLGLVSRPVHIVEGPRRGQLDTSVVWGDGAHVFGSVASAGRMLNLDSSKLASAMGIAGHNAPVPTRSLWSNSRPEADAASGHMRGVSPGWIAHVGVAAALLAETGYQGNVTVLDGEAGFWRVVGAEGWRPDTVTEKLGQEWHIPKMRFKLYPSGGLIHSAMDAFVSIIDANQLMPDEIKQVKAWVHPTFLQPLWANRDPSNEVQAQMSGPYLFALLAHRIPPGMEWRAPANMKSPKIRAFMDKVTLAIYDYGPGPPPNNAPDLAKVDVVARGRTYHEERTFRRGSPTPKEVRMSDEDLAEKFRNNAAVILRRDKADEVVKSIWEMESLRNVSRLMDKLRV